MTVHLLAPVPHTDLGPGSPHPCAYSDKVYNLARMLAAGGHRVVLYASEASTAPCDELVPIVTAEDRARWFGEETWTDRVFDLFDATAPCWAEPNARAVEAIRERARPGDTLAVTMGYAQKPVADALPGLLAWESGVGYEGVWAPFRVYESQAWMHWLYGRDRISDGRYFDAVIPNAYDPADFKLGDGAGGYLLFLGRHTERKGLEVVRQIAQRRRVVTAGQDGPLEGAEWRGVVRGVERAALLAGAEALLAPTGYIEPFGGVAVEAQLSGTPVICTDWGAFSETVDDGLSGFRCRTLAEFLVAVERVDQLDRTAIMESAIARFSLAAVGPLYDAYLRRLDSLRRLGWYELGDEGEGWSNSHAPTAGAAS